MKQVYVDSLGLNQGFRISQYETLAEVQKAAGKDEVIVDVVNKYLRQKGALVDARDVFIEKLQGLTKFAPVTKKVTKKDSDGKEIVQEVWDETEGEYLARFKAAILKGTFTHARFPADETKLNAALQNLADECGDTDDNGKPLTDPPSFVLDIKVPERKARSIKPPKYATDAATNIINNKSVDKWVKTLQKEGHLAKDFAAPTETGALTLALAWAIKAREDARSKAEYA